MGRVIIVDGPEKAGKSTLIKELTWQLEGKGVQVHHRRWGQIKPDDRVYSAPLQQDLGVQTKGVTIWDRGWPSEHVYGKLLNRQRRGATNPWILEWLHGRAVHGRGIKAILLPEDSATPAQHRDDTDLPVSVSEEIQTYTKYGRDFGYDFYMNNYTEERVQHNATSIINSLPAEEPVSARYLTHTTLHPEFSPRLIVGEGRNPNDFKTMAGAWLPFSSAKMCQFVQKYFGNEALRLQWCNMEDFERGVLPISVLKSAGKVYTFGRLAEAFALRNKVVPAYSFLHPAFFARWNTDRGRAALQQFEAQYKAVFGLS